MNAIESTINNNMQKVFAEPVSQLEKINKALIGTMDHLTKEQLIESIAEYFLAFLPSFQSDLGTHLIEKSIVYERLSYNYQFVIPIFHKPLNYRSIQHFDNRFESVVYDTFINYQFIPLEAEKYQAKKIEFYDKLILIRMQASSIQEAVSWLGVIKTYITRIFPGIELGRSVQNEGE